MMEEQTARRLFMARLLAGTALGTPLLAAATEEAEAATILFESTQFLAGNSDGVTKRTMTQRTTDVYNVKDYGALGNGSNDDTSAINAAVTASGGNGTILFPGGTYKITAPIAIPGGSHLIFQGTNGAAISANFNGFAFDNLTDPYNPATNCVIEDLNIQNGFVGNTFSVPANGTWSASGSPVNITLSGSNPGVAAGGALWVSGSGGLGTNSVFIGMITSVASWPTVTVSSALVGSGANPNCAVHVIQCYAAGASWTAGANTITMAATRPAGIGTGQYYLYNYENYLADPRYDFPLGVVTWSGTTVTFTPNSGGALQNSTGSADRLWFAPVAGCIRLSSVSMAKVDKCVLAGFYCITSSEDKITTDDPSGRSAQGFHICAQNCDLSNPSGFSGLLGQTGIYFENNSVCINVSASGHWCSYRFSGTSNGIIDARAEVSYFGVIIGGDFTPSNGTLTAGYILGMSMESNIQALYCKGGNAILMSTGCSCNVSHQALGGFYLSGFSGALVNVGIVGHFDTGYGLYIVDPGSGRGSISCIRTSAVHLDTPSQGWRIPAAAWWGTCDSQCDNPPLEYTFSNLPTGSSSPTPIQGETYDISDCNTSAFLATAAGGGSTGTAHRRVRYNATSAVWQVVG